MIPRRLLSLSSACLLAAALVASAANAQTPAGRDDAALAYAQCMRDNGYSEFPDPTPDGDLRIDFAEGEAITTEYSYKYRPERFQALAERAGWRVEKLWTDERRWFGEWLLVV